MLLGVGLIVLPQQMESVINQKSSVPILDISRHVPRDLPRGGADVQGRQTPRGIGPVVPDHTRLSPPGNLVQRIAGVGWPLGAHDGGRPPKLVSGSALETQAMAVGFSVTWACAAARPEAVGGVLARARPAARIATTTMKVAITDKNQ